MLHILDRNMRIKSKPEKFQESKNRYDLIFTCEEKVYDQVVESFESAGSSSAHPVHIINIDIIDNPEDATIGTHNLINIPYKCHCIFKDKLLFYRCIYDERFGHKI